MITVIFIISWLACGLLAAGWMKADLDSLSGPECELLTVAVLLFAGPIAVAVAVGFRISEGEAHGWRWPFADMPRSNFKGHWFKRDTDERMRNV